MPQDEPIKLEGVIIVGIVVLVFMLLLVLWWIRGKLLLNDQNCNDMNSLYRNFPLIHSIQPDNETFKHHLRDYYIKTAYNCCASGQFKNDFVNVCALKDCIKQGARCLDFEIYSVDNKPVIAVSSLNEYYIKETFNSVDFQSAMEVIADYAFTGSNCPNPSDPLILNFRIMSTNKLIYNDMAEILSKTLGSRLLGKFYSYENHGANLGRMRLKKVLGKIIVIVDKSNALFVDTKLDEYVNMASSSVFMRSLRERDVRFSPDVKELTEFNKKNMSIVLPDKNQTPTNMPAMLAMHYGCQMIGLSFQLFDAPMEFYTKFFDDAGTAFVLKPADLRYVPVTIAKPAPVPEEYSYERRIHKAFPGAPKSLNFVG
jgi:hypothetical protein